MKASAISTPTFVSASGALKMLHDPGQILPPLELRKKHL